MRELPPAPKDAPPGRWVDIHYLKRHFSQAQVQSFQQHPTQQLYWLPNSRPGSAQILG